jgi:deoxyribonuclease-4
VRNPVGSHVFVGKGLVAGALRTAGEIGAETLQVFVGNPRGWALSAGDAAVDAAFAEACADRGLRAFVHTPYLVNLGSPTAATYERSVATIAHNLARAAQIGAEGIVVHTGSCVDEGTLDQALRQVREGLMPVLEGLDDRSPWLLLEPTAGQGRSLCGSVDDLEPYLDVLDRHPRVGICLDTCHVFAAGAPLDEPGGATRTLDRLLEVAGPDRLRLVHANDSKDARGSLRDRHERIGEGHIGPDAFLELFAHPATDGVPFVAETPGSGQLAGPCLPLLRKLRDQAAGLRDQSAGLRDR